MATLRQQIKTNVLTVTRFRELMRKLRENRPNDDLDLVKKAYEFSQKHHAGQSRASGEPYLVHPLEVGNVLADMKMDSVSIAAGLLHDSVEDTSVTAVAEVSSTESWRRPAAMETESIFMSARTLPTSRGWTR